MLAGGTISTGDKAGPKFLLAHADEVRTLLEIAENYDQLAAQADRMRTTRCPDLGPVKA
jgi:hypothetical protein